VTELDRHLSPGGFADYLEAAVPAVIPVPGEPSVVIFVDPLKERIGLRTPLTSEPEIPSSPLEHIRLAVINAEGVRHLEISATDPETFAAVYPMLCAVADAIQLDGAAPVGAFQTILERWRRVLARRDRLSAEDEIGLFGELSFLEALAVTRSATDAIASWRGPNAEEHDFGFSDLDLEVKTTTGERRRHWISTATQLVPSHGRALWLVSIQITRAGAGHGRTLRKLVDDLGTELGEASSSRFEDLLRASGWDADHRDLYTERWQLRSEPKALLVDETFPALTPRALAVLAFEPGGITRVRYEVDVTDRLSRPPAWLGETLEVVR
jgi:hypothetical protein